MSRKSILCNPSLLKLSLDERLSEAEEQALSRHLSECEHCQRELERLAGREQDWSRIGSALKFDVEQHGTMTQSAAFEAADSKANDTDDNAADFAVDFLEPSPVPDALGRLGGIDIVEVIGRGGMGLVLKGHQSELKRLVAVKVMAPHLAVSGAARKRFAREAQAAAAILHPNVMPIHTVNSMGKLPYLVMPYLAGESLQQRIERIGPLELADLLRIAIQAAQGLAAAHAQGLIHRDVKPANILLEQGVERAMLTDFGLARAIDDGSITRTGLIAGTPQYMSPEQARGEPLDARSDLFSLGAVLYCMATGRPPFRAESTYGILRRIVEDQPRAVREVNPQIPEWLAAIIGKLLSKRPADRFSSANELAALLQGCLAHVQQPMSVPLPGVCQSMETPFGNASPPRKRRRVVAAAVLTAMATGVAALLAVGWPSVRSLDNQTADVATSAPANSTSNPDTNWDRGATELGVLQQAGDQFAARAGQLWDQEPQRTIGGNEQPGDTDQSLPNDIQDEGGWDPYGNTNKLAAMKGWVLAWDRRNYTSHGDGKRRAMLRVFGDGRVFAVLSYGDPLLQGKLTAKELKQVVDNFVAHGTERKPEALKIDTALVAMPSETYKELQSALRKLEREHALGDPLPGTLWDQTADRVTVLHDDRQYDLMSVSPSLSAKPGRERPVSVAEFTGELRAKLGELVVLAAIGSTDEIDRLVTFADKELRRRHPDTPIRLSADHLSYAGRNRDGALYVQFDFTGVPNKYSFPSGELTLQVPRGGEPYVAKARYWIDAMTDDRWGRRAQDASP